MDRATSGSCLACGEETTVGCGTCRRQGINLFFCSKEHQKLLWPAHKKVCGPGKANPFTWPDLTREEAAEAQSHLETKFNTSGAPQSVALGDLFRMWGCGGKESIVIDLLIEGRPHTLEPLQRQDLLVLVRSVLFERHRGQPPVASDAQRALAVSSHFMQCCLTPYHLAGPLPAHHSLLHHHLLTALLLVVQEQTAPNETRSSRASMAAQAVKRLIALVEANVRAGDPAAADKLVASLSPLADTLQENADVRLA
ncbi:hypothetical protein JCM8097_004690 [Rhodosporidiobolus ruineniae]